MALVHLFAVGLVTAGCGTAQTPAAPAPSPNYPAVGIWQGRILDATRGEGVLRVDLAQPGTDSAYRGTWTTTFDGVVDASGTAVGTTIANPMLLSLRCDTAGGSIGIVADVQPPRMSGRYSLSDCGRYSAGSIDLVRQ
jgi:hypothetical protein